MTISSTLSRWRTTTHSPASSPARNSRNAPCSLPSRPQRYATLDPESQPLEAELEALEDKQSEEATGLRTQIDSIKQETPHYHAPWAHVVYDAAIYVEPDGPDKTQINYRPGEPRDVAIFQRGNPANPGEIVPRRFLTVLTGDAPPQFEHGSGRLELAQAILTDGRPLAARVIVNRVWRHHFGAGLVRTPSDFGAQGQRPTHPELLDDLTARFIDHDWSLKWLHREVLLSATWQQSSEFDPTATARDPDNRLLWRMNRQRLDIEAWRDAMLVVADHLNDRIGGPPLPLDDEQHRQRTIYGRVGRREMNDMLRLFDFPMPSSHSERRNPTTTPLQQLYVLNSPFLDLQANNLAARLQNDPNQTTDSDKVDFCYQLLFARSATDNEQQLAAAFLSATPDDVELRKQQWHDYVHALLGLNEFAFVD